MCCHLRLKVATQYCLGIGARYKVHVDRFFRIFDIGTCALTVRISKWFHLDEHQVDLRTFCNGS